MSNNKGLTKARKDKNDEFYTLYEDIEKEVEVYFNHDSKTFKDKVVYLPCDRPEKSKFFKYFLDNFDRFGLKRLITTSYVKNDFGYICDVTDPQIIEVKRLEGDGDFRSPECTEYRECSDMIITNPPFSLYREFVDWVYNNSNPVKYLILGLASSITYKNVFPLIKNNDMWVGATGFNAHLIYDVPDGFTYTGNSDKGKELAKKNQTLGPNTAWFTNMNHGKTNEPLELKTVEEIKKGKNYNKLVDKGLFCKYDNYDAIEIPRVDSIPSDYFIEEIITEEELEKLKETGLWFEILEIIEDE